MGTLLRSQVRSGDRNGFVGHGKLGGPRGYPRGAFCQRDVGVGLRLRPSAVVRAWVASAAQRRALEPSPGFAKGAEAMGLCLGDLRTGIREKEGGAEAKTTLGGQERSSRRRACLACHLPPPGESFGTI